MAYTFPHESLGAESSYWWVLGPARIESRAASKIGCNLQGRSDNYRILRSLQHSSSRGFGGDVEPRRINTLMPSPFQCGRPMHWTFEGTNAFRISIGSIGTLLTLLLETVVSDCRLWSMEGVPPTGDLDAWPRKKWCEGCHDLWNIKLHQAPGQILVRTENEL